MSRKDRKCYTRNDTSIVAGKLYFEDSLQCEVDSELFQDIVGHKSVTSIRLVSLDHIWQLTVYYADTTRVEEINVQMTLRKERRGASDHWYAYRRVLGKLYKRYVGQTDKLTQKRLLDVARKMPSAF